MKNNKRNIFLPLVSATLAVAFSSVAFAANIDENKAIEIALEDAKYNSSDVIYSKAEYDFDDGREQWDVEFLIQDEDGLYREYNYELSAKDGSILEKEWDIEDDYRPVKEKIENPKAENSDEKGKVHNKAEEKAPVNAEAKDIGRDKAKQAAFEAFGFDENEVKLIRLGKDYDDGAEVYEVKFRQGFKAQYSCEVLAYSGEVTDKDAEYVEGFFNKIEFGFELFGDWLEGLFDW